ncbi:MAG TPA: hypothetical protein VGG37_07705 [Opitutaceae bacterium]|jgi:hypothetical protein
MGTRGTILAFAALALFVGAEAAILRADARLRALIASTDGRIRVLRNQALARGLEASAAAKSAREGNAEAKRMEEGGAPNHARILRILGALEAAKRRHGSSDPLKFNFRYAHAGWSLSPSMMSDPDYANRARFIGKFDAEKDNWLLLRQVGEAGIDTDRMATLLSERSLAPMEAHALAEKDGLSPKDSGEAAESQQRNVQAEIGDLLGPDHAKLLDTIGAFSNGTFSAQMLESRLSYAAAPMDEKQYAAVVALFGGQSPQLILEGRYDPGLAAKVQAVLAPDQFAAYEALLREQKTP